MASTIYDSDFDEDQGAIDRRRAQLINAMRTPIGGAGSGWGGALANFLQNSIGTAKLMGQDDLGKQLAQRRSDAAQQAIANMPKDTPAQPAINTGAPDPSLEQLGGGPAAPQPTGGMVPGVNAYQPATPMIPANVNDWASWAGKYSRISPMMGKVAEKGLDLAMAAPEKARLAAEALQAKKDAQEAALKQAKELALQKADDKRDAATAAAAAALERDRERAADRETAIRVAASLRPGKEPRPTSDVGYDSATGRPVIRTAEGARYRLGEDGLPEATPFKGDVMPSTVKEKEVAKTQEAQQHLGAVADLLDQAKSNKAAFGTPAAIGASLPVVGPWIAEKALTPEQRQSRAEFAAQGAEVTHRLYGSAFSAGEQSRAEPFIVKPTDPPELVISKMETMHKMAQAALAAKSSVARATATVRATGSGGERPPLSSF